MFMYLFNKNLWGVEDMLSNIFGDKDIVVRNEIKTERMLD